MMRKVLFAVLLVAAVMSFAKTRVVFWQFMMDDALAKEVLVGF